MKMVIAIRGFSNAGKSSTIRLAFTLLRDKWPEATVRSLTGAAGRTTKDIHVIFTIGTFTIGIESQGDPSSPPSRLEKSLDEFVAKNCDVILCATRGSGRTNEIVEGLVHSGYDIIWRDRDREIDSSKFDLANREEAINIVARVEALYNASRALDLVTDLRTK